MEDTVWTQKSLCVLKEGSRTKNPQTKTPWTKTPLAKNPPEKTYEHKIYFTKINSYLGLVLYFLISLLATSLKVFCSEQSSSRGGDRNCTARC